MSTGPTGVRGPQGEQGEQGEDGTYWFVGTGAPTSTVPAGARVFDKYLDDATDFFYEKATSTTWTLKGSIHGSVWHTGSYVPDNSNPAGAVVGDYYLRTSTGDYYERTSAGGGTWVLRGSIRARGWYVGTALPSAATPPLTIVGDLYLHTPSGNYYEKVALSDPGAWELKGNLKGEPGGLSDRLTATFTTSSIAAGVNEQSTIAMAKGYRLYRIVTSHPARVRLYGTAVQQALDVARSRGTDPTGNHGLMFDFATTASVLDWGLSPMVDGMNLENVPTAAIPITVTNLDTQPRAVTVTLTYVRTE